MKVSQERRKMDDAENLLQGELLRQMRSLCWRREVKVRAEDCEVYRNFVIKSTSKLRASGTCEFKTVSWVAKSSLVVWRSWKAWELFADITSFHGKNFQVNMLKIESSNFVAVVNSFWKAFSCNWIRLSGNFYNIDEFEYGIKLDHAASRAKQKLFVPGKWICNKSFIRNYFLESFQTKISTYKKLQQEKCWPD